jgi:hypothetical protein
MVVLAAGVSTMLILPLVIQASQVDPNNHTYGLAVGDYGLLYSFDGHSLTRIPSPTHENLTDVQWRHDTKYALITGEGGILLKYDGINVEQVSTTAKHGIDFNSVTWTRDDSTALIAGTDHSSGTIRGVLYRYEETGVEELFSQHYSGFNSIQYNPANNTLALLVGVSSQNYAHGIVELFDGHDLKQVSSNTNDTLHTVAWSPDGHYALIGGSIHGLTLNATLLQYESGIITQRPTSDCCFTNDAHGIRAISFNPERSSVGLINGNKGLVIAYEHDKMVRTRDYTNLSGNPEDLHHIGDFYGISWVPRTSTAYTVGGNLTVARINDLSTVDLIDQTIGGPRLHSIAIVDRNPKLAVPNQRPLTITSPPTILDKFLGAWSTFQQPFLLATIFTTVVYVMITAFRGTAKPVGPLEQPTDPVSTLNPDTPDLFTQLAKRMSPQLSRASPLIDGIGSKLRRLDWYGIPRRAWVIILSQIAVIISLTVWAVWEYFHNIYLQYYVASVGPVVSGTVVLVSTAMIGLWTIQYFRTRNNHRRRILPLSTPTIIPTATRKRRKEQDQVRQDQVPE